MRVILCLLCALPLFADTGRHVARIEVRSGHIPANVIRAQSVLEEGRTYTDADLEVALARLRRLPFVFDARYAFEGETLILTVDDTTRLYFDLDADARSFTGDSASVATLGGGGRLFLRSGGVFQLSGGRQLADGGNGHVIEAEYAHYGSRLFAVLGVTQMSSEDLEFDPFLRLTVGYPLTLRTTLIGSASREGFARTRTFRQLPRPIEARSERTIYDVRWLYDTTDDPYFALRGLSVSAGPRLIRETRNFETFFGTTIIPNDSTGTLGVLALDSSFFVPLLSRSAFSTTLAASRESGDYDEHRNGIPIARDITSTAVALSVTLSHNFFTRAATPAARQRLELGAGLRRQKFEDSQFADGPWFEDREVHAGWVLRHPAATVRVNLAYVFQ